jgi:hypothetical protein
VTVTSYITKPHDRVSSQCRQASRLPAFQAADPAHVDLFAAANVRLWDEIARSSTSAWTRDMAQAAHMWFAFRQADSNPAATHPDDVRPRRLVMARQVLKGCQWALTWDFVLS